MRADRLRYGTRPRSLLAQGVEAILPTPPAKITNRHARFQGEPRLLTVALCALGSACPAAAGAAEVGAPGSMRCMSSIRPFPWRKAP